MYPFRPGGEAVTHRSAKPTFTGSNPVLVSIFKKPTRRVGFLISTPFHPFQSSVPLRQYAVGDALHNLFQNLCAGCIGSDRAS